MAAPALTDAQRAEISRRLAAGEKPTPIAAAVGCTVDAVKYYARKKKPLIEKVKETFAPQLAAERAARDADAEARIAAPILEGLREAEGRVDTLVWLASELKHALETGGWQSVGFGGVPHFRRAEVEQLRGALDDLAKETGGRKQRTEVTGKDGGAIETAASVVIYLPDNGRDAGDA